MVLAGPSAVGKSSVVRRLRELLPDLMFSVSATTRDPRAGEVDGRDYLFVGPDEFDRLIEAGELLEWAEIHGGLQRSGTPARPVFDAMEQGRPTLVEVDLAGARNIRDAVPEAVTVFLAPPSWDVLVSRLRGRGTESDEIIERRLETARAELDSAHEFDHVVVNDEVDSVAKQLLSLLVESHLNNS
ncbi:MULTISPECIES: guanylate kinase [Mycobacteriales]|uniref:Guanylate kinase n=1 Tax=Gordonia rubripertincta TaxID=36822 RepID=A0ABT4MUT2_GORRU|nr:MULTISPECIES: guanylate kinase [Mycobacteriales]MCZ4550569.1 guanylate kinase [Gordonia rubripertincta]